MEKENKNSSGVSIESQKTEELKAAFTPGPWALKDDSGDSWYRLRVYAPGNLLVANILNNSVRLNPEANARLIAAAPALYAALKLLVADVQDYEPWQRPCHALDVASAALSLAKEEEE